MLTARSAAATMANNEKLSCCAFAFCPGRTFCTDQSCFVCGVAVHAPCFVDVAVGQNYTPGIFYCSIKCICYDKDDNIDNAFVKAKRETFLANNKNALRTLACGVGAKISYHPPGQGLKDLSKEGIVCRIMEKEFTDQLVVGQAIVGATASALGNDSAPVGVPTMASPSIVTIHDNFRLANIMFCEEVMEVSSQCGSAATCNELDTNMVGSNSPFWNKVASLFHSKDGCDPATDGVDFLDKLHFEHTYYVEHHETIDPSKHGLFSSFTAVAMHLIKHQES
jgi:hypothetical protein